MLPQGLDFTRDISGAFAGGIDGHISPIILNLFQAFFVNVHSDHTSGPERFGYLNHILPYATDTDNNNIVIDLEVGSFGCLKWSCCGIRHHGQMGQGDLSPVFDFTKIDTRYGYVA